MIIEGEDVVREGRRVVVVVDEVSVASSRSEAGSRFERWVGEEVIVGTGEGGERKTGSGKERRKILVVAVKEGTVEGEEEAD